MYVLLVRLIVLRCDAAMLNTLLSLHRYLYRTPKPTNPDITVLYADIDKRGGHAHIQLLGSGHSSGHSIQRWKYEGEVTRLEVLMYLANNFQHPVIDNLYSALDDYLVCPISGARPESSIRAPLPRLCLSSFNK
jgi:hypothetical protein